MGLRGHLLDGDTEVTEETFTRIATFLVGNPVPVEFIAAQIEESYLVDGKDRRYSIGGPVHAAIQAVPPTIEALR